MMMTKTRRRMGWTDGWDGWTDGRDTGTSYHLVMERKVCVCVKCVAYNVPQKQPTSNPQLDEFVEWSPERKVPNHTIPINGHISLLVCQPQRLHRHNNAIIEHSHSTARRRKCKSINRQQEDDHVSCTPPQTPQTPHSHCDKVSE